MVIDHLENTVRELDHLLGLEPELLLDRGIKGGYGNA
jgi:hypothetical protein